MTVIRHGRCMGGTQDSIHRIWVQMRDRCRRAKCHAYSDYGGRGITVCERWQVFENFLKDMGERPSKRHSLDRIDNDGGYWCGRCEECISAGRQPNCRWATQSEQLRNTRKTRWVTINGETRSLAEWAELTGVGYTTIRERINRGWPAHEAVFGRAPTKSEMARRHGISVGALNYRLARGMSLEEALVRPVIFQRPKRYISDTELSDIDHRWRAGKSLTKLASELDVNSGTLWRMLQARKEPRDI